MIDALILRFDAPIVAFGGVLIDAHGVTRSFPARSMLTGLLGNALGYGHRDAALLQALQARIHYAVRCDRPGQRLRDFQTVDLSQPFLWEGWTTRGTVQGRYGESGNEIKLLKSAFSKGQSLPLTKKTTSIRRRDYIADSVYTVALALDASATQPDLAALADAVREPGRPLFIGRKSCLPAEPVFVTRLQAASLREALITAPLSKRAAGHRFRVWLPADGPHVSGALPLSDDRDWANQIHVGRRFILEAFIDV